jgi:ABC-type proline/glycine betaine transport system substrate-binding protein
MMKRLIVIGAAVLLSATAAMAQQRGPAGACAADIKVKCAGVQPGEGRLSACVKGKVGGGQRILRVFVR